MDVVIFTFLVAFSLILGGLCFLLPARPLTYKIIAILLALFGSVLSTLTSIQLIADGNLVVGSATDSIYPIAYIPFFIIIFDGFLIAAKSVEK